MFFPRRCISSGSNRCLFVGMFPGELWGKHEYHTVLKRTPPVAKQLTKIHWDIFKGSCFLKCVWPVVGRSPLVSWQEVVGQCCPFGRFEWGRWWLPHHWYHRDGHPTNHREFLSALYVLWCDCSFPSFKRDFPKLHWFFRTRRVYPVQGTPGPNSRAPKSGQLGLDSWAPALRSQLSGAQLSAPKSGQLGPGAQLSGALQRTPFSAVCGKNISFLTAIKDKISSPLCWNLNILLRPRGYIEFLLNSLTSQTELDMVPKWLCSGKKRKTAEPTNFLTTWVYFPM